ncbi:hypothetical protein RvY_16918 [Ramazzottius varieornatus]|uniref:Uncharacterized protein n=1 Tax=Ramazzottius varieornatus TaxID=947166 RepID=A0A1D1W081_RAMVA|nr:hypothetical protein RvY_16918 [Ramazzottius varieornatus]
MLALTEGVGLVAVILKTAPNREDSRLSKIVLLVYDMGRPPEPAVIRLRESCTKTFWRCQLGFEGDPSVGDGTALGQRAQHWSAPIYLRDSLPRLKLYTPTSMQQFNDVDTVLKANAVRWYNHFSFIVGKRTPLAFAVSADA